MINSSIDFPKQELRGAYELVRAIADAGDVSLDWKSLAGRIKHAPDGGAFRKRNATARGFGLIDYGSGHSVLTPLGLKLSKPRHQQDALQEAFLSVDLFRKLFENYRGDTLPPDSSILIQLKELGLYGESAETAKNVFIRSAKFARLIDEEGRLIPKSELHKPMPMITPVITPLIIRRSGQPVITPLIKPMGAEEMAQPVAEDDEETGVDPALLGLMQRLPPPGTIIGPKRRKGIIDAFASTINFLYPEEEE